MNGWLITALKWTNSLTNSLTSLDWNARIATDLQGLRVNNSLRNEIQNYYYYYYYSQLRNVVPFPQLQSSSQGYAGLEPYSELTDAYDLRGCFGEMSRMQNGHIPIPLKRPRSVSQLKSYFHFILLFFFFLFLISHSEDLSGALICFTTPINSTQSLLPQDCHFRYAGIDW